MANKFNTTETTATIYEQTSGWHWKPKGRFLPSPPFASKEAAKAAARVAGFNTFFIDTF
jgi:hypothetical protein